MAGKATSFDIAQLAGVSQPTVSRALRGSPTVSEQTRKRIEAIAQQLNYKVDKNASNLRLRESRTLALLFFEDPTPDESMINPFFLSMLGSITRTCALRGYDLLISFQQMSANWHVDYEDSRKADGIILLGYGDYELFQARQEQLLEQGTHFVRWGYVEAGQTWPTIGCDNFRGGLEAGRHLLAHGRRKLAFLGDASSHYPEFQDRYRGYLAAQEAEGLPHDPVMQHDALNSQEAGYAAAHRLIKSGATFDAIFAASDTIAIGAMQALRDNGMEIPCDVAIIGFDDLPAASLTHPPLTTIQQDYRRAGEYLVDSLIQRIRNVETRSHVLPAKLIIRNSCGAH